MCKKLPAQQNRDAGGASVLLLISWRAGLVLLVVTAMAVVMLVAFGVAGGRGFRAVASSHGRSRGEGHGEQEGRGDQEC
jgi:hypothetical protein